jgi:hypothetical protein
MTTQLGCVISRVGTVIAGVLMRYPIGFLCICALGATPLVGCFDDFLESESCDGVVCPDDGNECTVEYCVCTGWWCNAECLSTPVVNGTDCTFDGLSGVCASGVCGENLCEGVVCDEDDDACTDEECDYVDGTCHFSPVVCDDRDECTDDTCNPVDGCIFTPDEDKEGTICESEDLIEVGAVGMCEAGACLGPCDPASEQILQCPIEGFEDFFSCCPGWEYCTEACYSEVQP